jgi:hypothetical protein
VVRVHGRQKNHAGDSGAAFGRNESGRECRVTRRRGTSDEQEKSSRAAENFGVSGTTRMAAAKMISPCSLCLKKLNTENTEGLSGLCV